MQPHTVIRAAVIGATGYSGQELLRLLLRHPSVQIKVVTSTTQAGKKVQQVLPAFTGMLDLTFQALTPHAELASCSPETAANAVTPAQIAAGCDIVFLSVPHGEAIEIVGRLTDPDELSRPVPGAPHPLCAPRIIDLSADFRIKDAARYKALYRRDHTDARNLAAAVYGLTEVYRDRVRGAKLIANPGCYATCLLLPLLPLVREGWLDVSAGIMAAAHSGISGAGKKPAEHLHFPEMNENIQAYKIGTHQHMGEVMQELENAASGKPVPELVFVPHLSPVTRGIFATFFAKLSAAASGKQTAELTALLARAYAGSPFVRVLDTEMPRLSGAVYSNCCDITVRRVPGQDRIVITSALDNLVKGAAGQAVQNMNVMFECDEKAGLI